MHACRSTLEDPTGTDTEKQLLEATMAGFVKRERIKSQFKTNKLYGLMRGDQMWYLTGNPLKPQGSRLSLRPIDPRMVFPINPEKDVDRIIGYDIVEQTVMGEDTFISRTRYLKPDHPDHPNTGVIGAPISYQVDMLEVDNWETEPKIKATLTPQVLMPTAITNLPIYHMKNLEEPGNPFGSSEMRGIERLMAGINQSITDEELTLALHGLGMYKSGKGQPRNAQGNPVPWNLGPGKVVHDETFDRVPGVTTVTPYLEHVKYLEDRIHRINGASDVAQGVVDVTVAESGIALQLRMGPIIDAAEDKDILINEVWDQLLFDLRSWFQAYEGLNFGEARPVCTTGAKLPRNVQEEFDRLLAMVSNDPPLITMGYFREACRDLGIPIPLTETNAAIATEAEALAALTDPTGSRLDEEAGAPDDLVVE